MLDAWSNCCSVLDIILSSAAALVLVDNVSCAVDLGVLAGCDVSQVKPQLSNGRLERQKYLKTDGLLLLQDGIIDVDVLVVLIDLMLRSYKSCSVDREVKETISCCVGRVV